MITTVNGNSNPQPSFGVMGTTIPVYTPQGTVADVIEPVQIVGLVPLVCADQDARLPAFSKCDCREWTNDDCYINPVFATLSGSDALKNDRNMFLLEFPFFYTYQWLNTSSHEFLLEEWTGAEWITTTTLTDNTYGTLYDFNSLCKQNWKGFEINWSLVLNTFGEGLYRFRVNYQQFENAGILVSEPFCLKTWSCEGTDVTVRWDVTIVGGRIGSIVDDQRVFEFCCEPVNGVSNFVTWEDQLRVYAFFGREKSEYERVQVEYQNGEIVPVRNEVIQKFEYESALQPKWVHDRLKAYAFMADIIYVSDYNWNNSDYEINRKRVTCDGAYEPEYNENTRYSNVKVQFKEGFQNVIRDKCCNLTIKNYEP